MTPTRAARQADTTCAELDQLAALLFGGPTVKDPRAHYANLRRQIHAAISRDNITAGIDGYRSRHGSTDGGGNSDSTPVEAAALRLVEGGQPADIVHAKVTLIVASVHQAWRAANGWDRALNLIPKAAPETSDEADWCPSCIRFQIFTPRSGKNRHCGWCRDFHADYGIEPPEALLRIRAGGRRLTTADLDQHIPPAVRARAAAKRSPFKWADGTTTGITPNPAA